MCNEMTYAVFSARPAVAAAVETLREMGIRLPTYAEVADVAGVPLATVSAVIDASIPNVATRTVPESLFVPVGV